MARPPKTLEQRLFNQAHITEDPDYCWEWIGFVREDGYARIGIYVPGKYQYKSAYAHRVSYELTYGAVPQYLVLDHLCRNRRCINPTHLEPVSHKENIRRGYRASGDKEFCAHGHAYTIENTYIRPTGRFECRICRVASRLRNRLRVDKTA